MSTYLTSLRNGVANCDDLHEELSTRAHFCLRNFFFKLKLFNFVADVFF